MSPDCAKLVSIDMIARVYLLPGSPGHTGRSEAGGRDHVERDQPSEEQALRQTPKVEPASEDTPKQDPDSGPPPQRTDD